LKKSLAVLGVALVLSSSIPLRAADMPAPTTAPTFQSPDAVVARVNGAPITMGQLTKPLVEGYGLNVLLRLVQLELAKQIATQNKVIISPDEITAERNTTIDKMFQDSNVKIQDKIDKAKDAKNDAEVQRLTNEMKSDNERGFQQFLESQHQSEADFNLVIETNVYLRKVAEPMLAGKITEDQLKQAFAAMYGETIECRLIQCASLQEVLEAKKRLKGGEPFEKVAREMSRNEATRATGGKLPAFSREMQGFPQAFRDAAFALSPGEVSDVVQAEGAYHLILLEKRNAPKVVKFEDVKESIRRELYDRAVQLTIRQLRQQIQDQALKLLTVEDPTLKKQLETRLAKQKSEIKDREEVRRQLDKEHIDNRNTTTNPALPPPNSPEPPFIPAPATNSNK
jgi:parvulin-like peptidyl-prolyl isomerase